MYIYISYGQRRGSHLEVISNDAGNKLTAWRIHANGVEPTTNCMEVIANWREASEALN